MKTPKITYPQKRTRYNQQRSEGEKTTSPSQTIQGETFTIQQLFQRAAIQGHFPIQEQEAPYVDVPELDEITSMYRQGQDLTDIQEHAEHLRNLQAKVSEAHAATQEQLRKEQKEANRKAIIKAHEEQQRKAANDKSQNNASE